MADISERIKSLRAEGIEALAAAKNESDLLEVKGRFFGKKGAISEILKGVSSLSAQERKTVGS
ncbi:MAG: hypothetical protein FWH25_04860, partial [Syntrophorhabdaceae bacterium]|nr:hypothetical protein [Syntrophorhabdaceae bacterium]